MTQWEYKHEGLTISASRTGSRAVVTWKGTSDGRSPGAFLGPVIQELADNLQSADVTVDFTQLEYMNSATVGPLVGLIKSLDAGGNSVLVVFSDADWQRTHLNCMMAIARTMRHVRVEGRNVS
jgi:anti-anti-sigma regulatory factor